MHACSALTNGMQLDLLLLCCIQSTGCTSRGQPFHRSSTAEGLHLSTMDMLGQVGTECPTSPSQAPGLAGRSPAGFPSSIDSTDHTPLYSFLGAASDSCSVHRNGSPRIISAATETLKTGCTPILSNPTWRIWSLRVLMMTCHRYR